MVRMRRRSSPRRRQCVSVQPNASKKDALCMPIGCFRDNRYFRILALVSVQPVARPIFATATGFEYDRRLNNAFCLTHHVCHTLERTPPEGTCPSRRMGTFSG